MWRLQDLWDDFKTELGEEFDALQEGELQVAKRAMELVGKLVASGEAEAEDWAAVDAILASVASIGVRRLKRATMAAVEKGVARALTMVRRGLLGV